MVTVVRPVKFIFSSFLKLPGHGADGCKSLPGDSDGTGPREDVLPAVPDVVWNQTPALSRYHPQGEKHQYTQQDQFTLEGLFH